MFCLKLSINPKLPNEAKTSSLFPFKNYLAVKIHLQGPSHCGSELRPKRNTLMLSPAWFPPDKKVYTRPFWLFMVNFNKGNSNKKVNKKRAMSFWPSQHSEVSQRFVTTKAAGVSLVEHQTTTLPTSFSCPWNRSTDSTSRPLRNLRAPLGPELEDLAVQKMSFAKGFQMF